MNKQWLDCFTPQLKFGDEGTGTFAGYGSTFGNVDSGRDIVTKGAFSATIPAFLKDGFIALGHDWGGLQIGYPTAAREDEYGLWVEGAFHSTTEAQDARTVMRERMAAGKSVGLSIGYGASPSGIEYRDDGVRLLKAVDLFEVSMVTVPMNALATVSGSKDGEMPAGDLLALLKTLDLDDPAALGAALAYAEHVELGAAIARLANRESKALAIRSADRVAFRRAEDAREGKIGKPISRRNEDALLETASVLHEHADSLRDTAKSIEKLVEDNRPANDVIPQPKPNPKKDGIAAWAEAQQTLLRLQGLVTA